MHKPAQVELQLDWRQLPYSETFEPITAGGSPAQRTIRKKGPYTSILYTIIQNKYNLEYNTTISYNSLKNLLIV